MVFRGHLGLAKLLNIPLQFFILGVCLVSGGSIAQELSLSEKPIDFNSAEGEKLLIESEAMKDYFPLSAQFVTQDNLAYCGVASIVMVLNALSIPAPETPEFGSYRVFTQENFFSNPRTQKVITAEEVSKKGMTVEQLVGDSFSFQEEIW